MNQRTDRRRHIPASDAIAAREARQEAVGDLRAAMTARTTALAKWQEHRHDCQLCEPLQPGCTEQAACHIGRPKLTRLRRAHERVSAARAALAPTPAAQLDLFG
jgi:hypothetical protein